MQISNSTGIKHILFAPIISVCKWFGKHHPIFLAHCRYFARFHKILNLNHPQTLNEKILYLSLKTNTSQWTRLADKFAVREYVKGCGLESCLIPLYNKWDYAEDINFENMPNEFIIKTNHGCGDAIIVNDKTIIDHKTITTKFRQILDNKYGLLESGKHYYDIPPCVIAEKLLHNDKTSAKLSTSLIDYKIWCFNGEPYNIFTVYNRNEHNFDILVYDLDWNQHPEYLIGNKYHHIGRPLPRPKNLDKMLSIAKTLSKGFPQVRVDLYNIDGVIYFGELTFTSLGGLMNYFTPEYQLEMGQVCNISNIPK